MTIHKEGYQSLLVAAAVLAVLNLLIYWLLPGFLTPVAVLSLVLFLIVLQFFRHPARELKTADDNNLVYAPADGKVVVIEEAGEPEYFKAKRLQVSIFMSPVNVHVNRNPVSGVVKYFRYHPGKFLVAWHPKSSTENERTTVVIGNSRGEILLRQIAGALAKRIVNYLHEGERVKQGDEMGFIKFGSRVDVFLPLGAKVEVEMGQKVKANVTVIAKL